MIKYDDVINDFEKELKKISDKLNINKNYFKNIEKKVG
jgi:hypothetical protein